MRKGYIGKEYAEVGLRAVKAVLEQHRRQRRAEERSFGTPVFDDLDGYRKIPLTSMPYGQAMAILALGEFLRAHLALMAARQVRFGHYLAYGSNDFLGAGAMSDHQRLDPVLLHHVLRPHGRARPASYSSPRGCSTPFFSPLIGYVSDHFHHTWLGRKFGRRRFFICWPCRCCPASR